MKKLVIITFCVALLITLFTGCSSTPTSSGNGDKTPANVTESKTPEKKIPDLTGEWKQANSKSKDSYQAATISGDTIEIYWVSDNGDTKSLYWAGSFIAPKTVDEPYIWNSKNDHSKTNSAMLASTVDTKTMTYQNGVLSYEASAMGTTTTVKLTKTPASTPAPDTKDKAKAAPEEYFKNGILVTKNIKIEITKYTVIPVGKKGNEYGDKPVLAFWYKVTNLSTDRTDPTTAWISTFKAIQDNDPNAVNTLNVGSLPDSEFLDSQIKDIKTNGTVNNAVAYELTDETTPVSLVAAKNIITGEDLGKQEYPVK